MSTGEKTIKGFFITGLGFVMATRIETDEKVTYRWPAVIQQKPEQGGYSLHCSDLGFLSSNSEIVIETCVFGVLNLKPEVVKMYEDFAENKAAGDAGIELVQTPQVISNISEFRKK